MSRIRQAISRIRENLDSLSYEEVIRRIEKEVTPIIISALLEQTQMPFVKYGLINLEVERRKQQAVQLHADIKASSSGKYKVPQEVLDYIGSESRIAASLLDNSIWFNKDMKRQFGIILTTEIFSDYDKDAFRQTLLRLVGMDITETSGQKFIIVVMDAAEKDKLIKPAEEGGWGLPAASVYTLDDYLGENSIEFGALAVEEKITSTLARLSKTTHARGACLTPYLAQGIEKFKDSHPEEWSRSIPEKNTFIVSQAIPEVDIIINGIEIKKEAAVSGQLILSKLLALFHASLSNPNLDLDIFWELPPINPDFIENIQKYFRLCP